MNFSDYIKDLVTEGEIELADAVLSVTNPDELHECQIMAVLKHTVSIREILSSREQFVLSAIASLGLRGFNTDTLRKNIEEIECGVV